jgi:hypothetical protein
LTMKVFIAPLSSNLVRIIESNQITISYDIQEHLLII